MACYYEDISDDETTQSVVESFVNRGSLFSQLFQHSQVPLNVPDLAEVQRLRNQAILDDLQAARSGRKRSFHETLSYGTLSSETFLEDTVDTIADLDIHTVDIPVLLDEDIVPTLTQEDVDAFVSEAGLVCVEDFLDNSSNAPIACCSNGPHSLLCDVDCQTIAIPSCLSADCFPRRIHAVVSPVLQTYSPVLFDVYHNCSDVCPRSFIPSVLLNHYLDYPVCPRHTLNQWGIMSKYIRSHDTGSALQGSAGVEFLAFGLKHCEDASVNRFLLQPLNNLFVEVVRFFTDRVDQLYLPHPYFCFIATLSKSSSTTWSLTATVRVTLRVQDENGVVETQVAAHGLPSPFFVAYDWHIDAEELCCFGDFCNVGQFMEKLKCELALAGCRYSDLDLAELEGQSFYNIIFDDEVVVIVSDEEDAVESAQSAGSAANVS